MKKITIHSEVVYLISLIVLSFSVAMLTAADFGISMIVAPAYILSQKLTFLTFGQSEYVIQGILFIIFCVFMKKFRPLYLVAFLTCLIYGAFLDIWRIIIPAFNPAITPVGSMDLHIRIIYFIVGIMLTCISIALCFRTYIYPQVYDFFVQGLSTRYNIKLTKFKVVFDLSFFALSLVLSLALFRDFVGINWGTIVMTITNGYTIGFFGYLIDKVFVIKPLFKKAHDLFVK